MSTHVDAGTAPIEVRRHSSAHARVNSLLPRDTAWTWLLSGALFTLYATVSIRRHERLLSTGFDLGIVEQAVRAYANGAAPLVEVKGPEFNVLGDHFGPILAILAPVYRLFPGPVTLLVAQALLLALAVVPIAGYAQRVLGRRAALVVGLGYGLSWGIAGAVGFDFHDVAFAVPLIACATVALAEGRLVAAVVWALPLVLVKEDLGLTVAVLGGLIVAFGRRALGLATAAFGLLSTAITVLVILPSFTPQGTFSAWWDAHRGGGESESLADSLERVTVGLLTPEPKVMMLILLVAPTAMLALRSPLLLLVLPTLGWRLTSDNSLYWGTDFHYSAVLMPIVFVAFVDGMRRWSGPGGPDRIREALAVSAAVTALLVPAYPLWSVAKPSTWTHDVRIGDARAVLAQIPDDVTVSASNRLVPQLASRTVVSVFGHPDSRTEPAWIVVDRGGQTVNWPFGSAQAQDALITEAMDQGYVPVAEQGDFVLLRRPLGETRPFPAPEPPPEQPEQPGS
ncbi:MAG: DUF2079 domain-containing protein [Sporichthyaceae bacterium]